jgi:hypothetical protein
MQSLEFSIAMSFLKKNKKTKKQKKKKQNQVLTILCYYVTPGKLHTWYPTIVGTWLNCASFTVFTVISDHPACL